MATLDQRLSSLEANMAVMQREVQTLRGQVGEQQGEILSLLPHTKATADRVERIAREVESISRGREDSQDALIREIRALVPSVAASAPAPIWESEQGRWMVRMCCGSAVLCCLALAGGMTFADLRGWWTAPTPTTELQTPSR